MENTEKGFVEAGIEEILPVAEPLSAEEAARQAAAYAEQAAREAAQAQAELEKLLAARAQLNEQQTLVDEAANKVVELAECAEKEVAASLDIPVEATEPEIAIAEEPIPAGESISALEAAMRAVDVKPNAPLVEEVVTPQESAVSALEAAIRATDVTASTRTAEAAAPASAAVTFASASAAAPTASANVAASAAVAPAASAPTVTEVVPTPVPEPAAKPKKKGKPWIWAILAVVVVAGIAVGMFFMNQTKTYDQAIEYYENGMYSEAAEEFQKLGGYKDSAEMYDKALKWVDAQSAERAAEENVDEASWLAAADAYDAINDPVAFEEAARCRKLASYFKGVDLLAKNPTDLNTALSAMEMISEAADVRDVDRLLAYCNDVVAYYGANDLYAQGRYYDAYKQYLSIGDDAAGMLEDLQQKINACIQPTPSSSVLWRSGSYSANDCELTIENAYSTNLYYKLYSGDDLVMTVFVRQGGEATFNLPSGDYRMNVAYGNEWFGLDDMFGDEGSYNKCDFGGAETVTLQSGYSYTITQEEGDGTDVGEESVDRGSM